MGDSLGSAGSLDILKSFGGIHPWELLRRLRFCLRVSCMFYKSLRAVDESCSGSSCVFNLGLERILCYLYELMFLNSWAENELDSLLIYELINGQPNI